MTNYRRITQLYMPRLDVESSLPFVLDNLKKKDNAGFKLLMKLGYKGGGLGKDGGGASNPIVPQLKQDRLGWVIDARRIYGSER